MSLREMSRHETNQSGFSETLGTFMAIVGVVFLLIILVMLVPMFPQVKALLGQ